MKTKRTGKKRLPGRKLGEKSIAARIFELHSLVWVISASMIVGCSDPEPDPAATAEALEEAYTQAAENYERNLLEEKFVKWEKAQPLLEQIEVLSTVADGDDVVMEFRNGTEHALEAIECRYIVQDPERTIPHHKEDIIFYFHDGGLEPGETKIVSAYDEVYHHELENHVTTIRPIVLMGPDLVRIADASMTQAEARELRKLREEGD